MTLYITGSYAVYFINKIIRFRFRIIIANTECAVSLETFLNCFWVSVKVHQSRDKDNTALLQLFSYIYLRNEASLQQSAVTDFHLSGEHFEYALIEGGSFSFRWLSQPNGFHLSPSLFKYELISVNSGVFYDSLKQEALHWESHNSFILHLKLLTV